MSTINCFHYHTTDVNGVIVKLLSSPETDRSNAGVAAHFTVRVLPVVPVPLAGNDIRCRSIEEPIVEELIVAYFG